MPLRSGRLVQLGRPAAGAGHAADRRLEGEIPPRLEICHECDCHHWPGEERCPFCGCDVAAATAAHAVDTQRREALIAEVQQLIDQARGAGLTVSEAS